MITDTTRAKAALSSVLLLWSGSTSAHGAELFGIYLGIAVLTFLGFLVFVVLWRASAKRKVVLFLLFFAAFPVAWIVALNLGDQAFGGTWYGSWLFAITLPVIVWIVGGLVLRPNNTVERDGPEAARPSR